MKEIQKVKQNLLFSTKTKLDEEIDNPNFHERFPMTNSCQKCDLFDMVLKEFQQGL